MAEPPPPPRNNQVLQYALIGLLALMLYTISSRIAAAADHSRGMNDLVLEATTRLGEIESLSNKYKQRENVPFTEQEHARYARILAGIGKIEKQAK